MKEESKKAAEVASRKIEKDVKAAKEEAANFKAKAEDLETRITRVYQSIKTTYIHYNNLSYL